MNEKSDRDNMNKALFANVVMMFGSSAMQQLGKLINPLSGKTEINLEGAQITIDMLSMLKEKTKGNLDKDEERMLNDLISSLQLNYVETAAAEEEKPVPTAKEGEIAGKAEQKESDKPQGVDGGTSESKDPKYHKSYGADKPSSDKT